MVAHAPQASTIDAVNMRDAQLKNRFVMYAKDGIQEFDEVKLNRGESQAYSVPSSFNGSCFSLIGISF